MWGETVASLAFGLNRYGWERENYAGVDLVVERRRGFALLVTAGDAAAGDERYNPQVRYERREMIQELVNGHFDTLWGSADRPEWQVWFLLHCLTSAALRAELSRPAWVGQGGFVTGWVERVLLPEMGFAGPDPATRGDGAAPPEVDVEVQRRTG